MSMLIRLKRRLTTGGAPSTSDLSIGEIAIDFVNRIIYGKNNDSTIVRLGGADAGDIKMYAGGTVPSGWLNCDGSAISRTTYADLFTAIGTTWGAGDGSTTFNIPDLRGRAPIGVGTGTGLTARALAATVGAETHTLTESEIPGHTHTLATGAGGGGGGNTPEANSGGGSAGTATTASTGGGGAHNNMQPSAAVYFLIKT